jgi:putative transcriptional regulator
MTRREALIAARNELGLTQQELADIVGISRAYLANIENGNYMPSLMVALRIAKAVKKDVEEVFNDCYVRKTNTA